MTSLVDALSRGAQQPRTGPVFAPGDAAEPAAGRCQQAMAAHRPAATSKVGAPSTPAANSATAMKPSTAGITGRLVRGVAGVGGGR